MPQTDFVIVRIVRRRDLHRARPELHVHDDIIGNDGDTPVQEGVFRELAVEVRVARVGGVHGDGGIAEHGLRTSGCDDDLFVCEAVSSGIQS